MGPFVNIEFFLYLYILILYLSPAMSNVCNLFAAVLIIYITFLLMTYPINVIEWEQEGKVISSLKIRINNNIN